MDEPDLITRHLDCCFRPYDEATVLACLAMTLEEACAIGAGTSEAWREMGNLVARADRHEAREQEGIAAARVRKKVRQRQWRAETARAAWVKQAMEASVF